MSYVVNEAAMAALFQSQAVELEVERVAETVRQGTIDKLTTGPSNYLHRNPAFADEIVGFSIKRDHESVFAHLGFMDQGHRSLLEERIAGKEANEHKWIGATLEEMKF